MEHRAKIRCTLPGQLSGKKPKDYGTGRACPKCEGPMSRYNSAKSCNLCVADPGRAAMLAAEPSPEREVSIMETESIKTKQLAERFGIRVDQVPEFAAANGITNTRTGGRGRSAMWSTEDVERAYTKCAATKIDEGATTSAPLGYDADPADAGSIADVLGQAGQCARDAAPEGPFDDLREKADSFGHLYAAHLSAVDAASAASVEYREAISDAGKYAFEAEALRRELVAGGMRVEGIYAGPVFLEGTTLEADEGDAEISAMRIASSAFKKLDGDRQTQVRVAQWLLSRFELDRPHSPDPVDVLTG